MSMQLYLLNHISQSGMQYKKVDQIELNLIHLFMWLLGIRTLISPHLLISGKIMS